MKYVNINDQMTKTEAALNDLAGDSDITPELGKALMRLIFENQLVLMKAINNKVR